MVIPTTFKRGEEAEFLVRIFTEKFWGESRQVEKHSFYEADGFML